jgi:hypothetical protein
MQIATMERTVATFTERMTFVVTAKSYANTLGGISPRSDDRLDRTQEVAGSSPASSIRITAANRVLIRLQRSGGSRALYQRATKLRVKITFFVKAEL